jgi:hypothetical protein
MHINVYYIKISAIMEPQKFERQIYHGAKIDNTNIVLSLRFRKFEENEKFRVVKVHSIEEYEAGCLEHTGCFGHMCITPNDIILCPQSFSMRTLEISTEYFAAAKQAFAGNKQAYIEKLRSTNYTKKGTMRCIMSTPVSGSARLIATPQWEFGRDRVAISPNLASRMKVQRKEFFESCNGIGQRYITSHLQEGDWVIACRPPSLSYGNTQPLKVVYWHKDCIGIHPETFSAFHGDFDGDETHLNPVYDKDSIRECESWNILPLTAFTQGRKLFNEIMSNNKRMALLPEESDENHAKFLEYTTLSAAQLKDGSHRLVFGNYSRNKSQHVQGIGERFCNSDTEASFVDQSIRGMQDVCKQQLSQGSLGDMTRVAKIAVSCFFRIHTGGLYVKTSKGIKLLLDDKISDIGTPAVRATMAICAVAQQAALDSHRAESRGPATHDFISDLILGCHRRDSSSPSSTYTMIVFDSAINTSTISDISWKYTNSEGLWLLCRPQKIHPLLVYRIKAAYNPVILAQIDRIRGDTINICRTGIRIICNYYSIAISDIELMDISYALSYMPSASAHPITTREGLIARKLGSIETLLATDYTKLPQLEWNFEDPYTTTSAMLMSNFNHLKLKHSS